MIYSLAKSFGDYSVALTATMYGWKYGVTLFQANANITWAGDHSPAVYASVTILNCDLDFEFNNVHHEDCPEDCHAPNT